MKILNRISQLALCGAVALAAVGCSDDTTEYSTEVAFKGGDGAYVCTAAGGQKDISFYSQCGHWEIAVPEGTGDWLEVWPLFGDDNGKTSVTVMELESAYARSATLDIVTARGVVGQIEITQSGADPYISFDLLSDRIRVDYLGTPITVNVASNLQWTTEVLPVEGQPTDWISFGEKTETSQEFLFEDNTNLPKRECIVRFKMVNGDYYTDLPVVQRAGNNLYENATEISIADLLAEVNIDKGGSYEIEGNYVVKAWVTSDFEYKNTPDSVIYLQDMSKRGLKLLLKDKTDFTAPPADRVGWYASARKLSVHICGLEFRKDAEGNMAIYDVPASVVMESELPDGSQSSAVVALSDFSKLANYPNTLVMIRSAEYVAAYGCYTNFLENQNMTTVGDSWKKDVSKEYKQAFADYRLYPQLLRDANGQVVKSWFSNDFTQKFYRNLPQGKGIVRGIVSTFRGEPVLQMRNVGDDAIEATGDRISTTLLKGGPWTDVSNTAASFAKGNADDDLSSVIFSVKNSTKGDNSVSSGGTGISSGMYWLFAALRYDSNVKPSDSDAQRYLSLNAMNWWSASGSAVSNTADAGEALILRTNTLRNATGSLWMSFSTSSSLGGPGWMKIQWAEAAVDADLTKVAFKDVATYDAPVANYTPYQMPYCVKLPDEMKGKQNVVILFRCASQYNAKRSGQAAVSATGTNRLGHLEIVEIK